MTNIIVIRRIPILKKDDEPIQYLANMLSGDIKPTNSEIKYDALPDEFTTLEEWPKKTNLHCYNCGCTTKRRPFFIPHIILNDVIKRGHNPMMCSPNCAVFYLKQTVFDKYLYNEKYKMIVELTSRMTNIDNPIIIPSENPACLSKHGGSVSDVHFQMNLAQCNSIILSLYDNDFDMIQETQNVKL